MKPRRTDAHRALALTILALLLGGCEWLWPPPTNLVIVCIDTVRADLFLHPALDDELSSWLDSGQVYEHALSVSPWTLPTLATVFTGLYPVQHGAGDFPEPLRNLASETPTALSPSADTLAEILDRNGYDTALFSAHPWLKPGFGIDQGFGQRVFYKRWHQLLGPMLDWIDRREDPERPFFAYLHLMESHDRHRASDDEVSELLGSLEPGEREFLDRVRMDSVCRKPDTPRCLRSQAYQLSVLRTRHRLAAILDSLDERALLKRTVVLVYSDHGEAFRERNRQHRQLQEDPRGMYGTGHGQYQFQELLHVPLLAWLPQREGARHAERVSLVDVFPSVLHWLDLTPTIPELPGTVLPPDGKGAPDRVLYASNVGYGPETIAILAGRFKAMYWPHRDRFLFFDLVSDPEERRPLEEGSLILEFSTLAGDYLGLPRYHAASAPTTDEAHLRDLQAIGYLQGLDESHETDAKAQQETD